MPTLTTTMSMPRMPPPHPFGTSSTLGDVLQLLDRYGAHRLVFAFDGRETKLGYHITEVKSGRFSAIDCGANPEAWTEIFIQLWDIPPEPSYQPLTAGKAYAVLGVVEKKIGLDRKARITFEVSDGVVPLALYHPAAASVEPDRLVISLEPRQSSCKPRDRWLSQNSGHPQSAVACCGTSAMAPKASCCE